MNNLKNEKGITLIALVITLVILSIISTITISASLLDNGVIDEAISKTEKAEINKYEELIEITRQEALSREYVLEMNGQTVLQGMLEIMNDPYADQIYIKSRELYGNFEIIDSKIVFITAEGYEFHITEEETLLQP